MSRTKDDQLFCRIAEEEKQKFIDKCSEMDRNASDMLREFVKAFNEDRLSIERPESEKGLYK